MHNGKTISLGNIIWRVLKNPLCNELSYEQAAEFTLEYTRLLGAPFSFSDETKEVEINDHKGALPENLVELRGVRSGEVALRYATNLYHTSKEDSCDTENTYIIQNCVIITSFNEGKVEVSYKAIPTDDKGYPLVPDNESFKTGLEYFIIHRHLEALWSMGKITDKVFQYYEQKRHFYSGQASNSLKLAGIDHLESAMNAINRLIVQTHPHNNFYKNFGEAEIIKKY